MGCGTSTTSAVSIPTEASPPVSVPSAPFYGVVSSGQQQRSFAHVSCHPGDVSSVSEGTGALDVGGAQCSSPYRPATDELVAEQSFHRPGWRSRSGEHPTASFEGSMSDANLPTTRDIQLGFGPSSSRETSFVPNPSPSLTTTTPDYNPLPTTTDEDWSSEDGYVRKVMKSHTEPQLEDFLRPPSEFLESSRSDSPHQENDPSELIHSQPRDLDLAGSVDEIAPLLRQVELLAATITSPRMTTETTQSDQGNRHSTHRLTTVTVEKQQASEEELVSSSTIPFTQDPNSQLPAVHHTANRNSLFSEGSPLETVSFYRRPSNTEVCSRTVPSPSCSGTPPSPAESYLWQDLTQHPDRRRSSGFTAVEPTDPGWWVPYATAHLKGISP
jgi:hypothetical protein